MTQNEAKALGKGHWWVVFSIVPSRHSFAWDGRGEILGQLSHSHHYHHRPSYQHLDLKGKAVVLSLILLSFYAEHHDRRKCVGLRERCWRWERLSRNLDWWRTRWWGGWFIYCDVCLSVFTNNYHFHISSIYLDDNNGMLMMVTLIGYEDFELETQWSCLPLENEDQLFMINRKENL